MFSSFILSIFKLSNGYKDWDVILLPVDEPKTSAHPFLESTLADTAKDRALPLPVGMVSDGQAAAASATQPKVLPKRRESSQPWVTAESKEPQSQPGWWQRDVLTLRVLKSGNMNGQSSGMHKKLER